MDTGRVALAALIGLGILGAGCRLPAWMRPAPVESPLPPEVMAEARDFYLRDCAPCHGVDAAGQGPDAGTLNVPPSDLTRLSALHGGTFPRDYVVDIVTGETEVPAHGTRDMPVWRQKYGPPGSGPAAVAAIYARRRMELLLRYLESVQRRPPRH